MNNHLSDHIHNTIFSLWKFKNYIFISMIAFSILGIIVYIVLPRTYIYESQVLLNDKIQLHTSDREEIDSGWTRERINNLLHAKQVLEQISISSGLITKNMSSDDKKKRLASLHLNLYPEITDKGMIKIYIKGSDPKYMTGILTEASKIFIYFNDKIYNDTSSPLYQSNLILSRLNGDIATKNVELASLSAKYTSEHSSIRKINSEINKLHSEIQSLELKQLDKSPVSLVNAKTVTASSPIENKGESYIISKYVKFSISPKLPLGYEKLLFIMLILLSPLAGLVITLIIIINLKLSSKYVFKRNKLEELTSYVSLAHIPKINI